MDWSITWLKNARRKLGGCVGKFSAPAGAARINCPAAVIGCGCRGSSPPTQLPPATSRHGEKAMPGATRTANPIDRAA